MRYECIYTPTGKAGRPRGIDVKEDRTIFYSEGEEMIIFPDKIEVTTYKQNSSMADKTWPRRNRVRERDLIESHARLKNNEDETSMDDKQQSTATREWTSLCGQNKQENQKKKKEELEATVDKPEQLRQDKSTKTEDHGIAVDDIPAGSPGNVFGDTCTPAKSIERAMEKNSPTDVSLSSTLFNEAEENQSTEPLSRNTGDQKAKQKCDNIQRRRDGRAAEKTHKATSTGSRRTSGPR